MCVCDFLGLIISIVLYYDFLVYHIIYMLILEKYYDFLVYHIMYMLTLEKSYINVINAIKHSYIFLFLAYHVCLF